MKLFYYFFDAMHSFNPQDYKDGCDQETLLQREPFAAIKQQCGFERLVLLHQVHGTEGVAILRLTPFAQDDRKKNPVSALATHQLSNRFSHPERDLRAESKDLPPFSINGDFLCTNQPNVALGIITADCAPIFLYDKKNNAIASIHAGWRGAVDGIIEQALATMREEYGSNRKDIQAIIGPCARACCYEVQPDFIEMLASKPWSYEKSVKPLVLSEHRESKDSSGPPVILGTPGSAKAGFDLGTYCKTQLTYLGIPENNINTDQNLCTICNDQFVSYRRNKTVMRQLSLVYML